MTRLFVWISRLSAGKEQLDLRVTFEKTEIVLSRLDRIGDDQLSLPDAALCHQHGKARHCGSFSWLKQQSA